MFKRQRRGKFLFCRYSDTTCILIFWTGYFTLYISSTMTLKQLLSNPKEANIDSKTTLCTPPGLPPIHFSPSVFKQTQNTAAAQPDEACVFNIWAGRTTWRTAVGRLLVLVQ